MESHHPQLIPVGFFTFWPGGIPWGALPPTVSQSLLLACSSPPNIDGLASAAIWANCWASDDSGNLPISSNLCSPPLHLTWSWRGLYLRHWRFCWCWGLLCLDMYLCPSFYLLGFSLLPLPWHDLCSCHT